MRAIALELDPGADKPKKDAFPWSADELHRMFWLPVFTYCATIEAQPEDVK